MSYWVGVGSGGGAGVGSGGGVGDGEGVGDGDGVTFPPSFPPAPSVVEGLLPFSLGGVDVPATSPPLSAGGVGVGVGSGAGDGDGAGAGSGGGVGDGAVAEDCCDISSNFFSSSLVTQTSSKHNFLAAMVSTVNFPAT